MTPANEFSHKVTVEPWPEDGIVLELTATAAERASLKTRFDLVGITSLSASVGIEKRMTAFVLAGTIEAIATQTCVATLQPVKASIEVPFERHYRTRATEAKLLAGGEARDPEEEIDVEILEGDEIDVGEAVAEEFYLALDPYPRAADADRFLEEIEAKGGATIGDRPPSPFEKLKRH